MKWGNERCIPVLINYYKLHSSSYSNYQVISISNGIKKSTIIPNLKTHKFLYFYTTKWAMLVMKHERMKLLTFRTKEWMEEWNLHQSRKHELLPQARTENMQRAWNGSGWGRKKEKLYSPGHVVPVCGSNPDYKWPYSPHWSHKPGLKVQSRLVAPTGTRRRPLVLVWATNRD